MPALVAGMVYLEVRSVQFAASRKKGTWMGGTIPLGHDVKDRKLVVNEEEADRVRLIFRQYLALGCVAKLQAELDARGIRTKQACGDLRPGIGGARSVAVPSIISAATGSADTAEIAGQFELILSARDADAKRKLIGTTLPARAVVTVGGIDVKFEVDGDIELA